MCVYRPLEAAVGCCRLIKIENLAYIWLKQVHLNVPIERYTGKTDTHKVHMGYQLIRCNAIVLPLPEYTLNGALTNSVNSGEVGQRPSAIILLCILFRKVRVPLDWIGRCDIHVCTQPA